MNIPADKLQHLKWGAGIAVALGAVSAVAAYAGIGYAIGAGSLLFAWGVERYQAIRREGTASYADMAFSAAPGLLLGAAIQAAPFLN